MFLDRQIGAVTLIFCLWIPLGISLGQEKPAKEFSAEDLEFFESKVRPLLIERCYECHGPDAAPLEGGLSLASRAAILAGGDTGPGIVPGNAEESLIIEAIHYGGVYEMPPDTKMAAAEIEILTKWVNQGAAWPHESANEIEKQEEFDIAKRKAAHWCWQPIKSPAVPSVKRAEWPLDPIDNFVLRQLEHVGLSPAAPADKRTLLRRVYFDLIGLPPSPGEIKQFVQDDSPDAYQQVVNQLLASPHFGERWARHWMDLTRYAETYGHEFDYPIAHAHKYRDYLIRALNADVPYNQFVEEHIAGDLLANPRRHPQQNYDESVIGTGFWFLGEATHAPVDVRGDEAGHIDNRIDVMSKTFLGLTVACARCHAHKFDAISTEDYYALAGFLQSSRKQMAMLDPDQKIANAFEKSSSLTQKGESVLGELVARVGSANEKKIAGYVSAAIELLRNHPNWHSENVVRFAGESLSEISRSGGESRVQELAPQGGVVWEDNKQLWWLDAEAGDTWKLEFVLTGQQRPETFEVFGDFTKANDYGIAQVSIDGMILKEEQDFFLPKLGKSGPTRLGELKLDGGKHTLEIKIVGHHKEAIPRHMVGIDWIEFRMSTAIEDGAIAEAAADSGLDDDLLERFVHAIKSASQRQVPSVAIEWLLQAATQVQPMDSELVTSSGQDETRDRDDLKRWRQDSQLFADFNGGLPADWFKSGFAFESDNATASVFSPVGHVARAEGTIHSGVEGPKFCGVIRSPTFKLEHPKVHYRLRGRDVTVRLIIDGYDLDVHNALLFNGITLNIDHAEDFAWHTQAGDIKNHLGHMAYLEIIDQGAGYFELDEIRFSNGANPPKPPTANALELKPEVTAQPDVEENIEALSRSLALRLKQDAEVGGRELISWIVENDLVSLFEDSSIEDVAVQRHPEGELLGTSRTPAENAERISTRDLTSELFRIRDEIILLNEQTPLPELVISMTDGTGEDERVFIRGNHKTLGEVVPRRFLSAISARQLNPPDGSGRLQLARKITAPSNPLTARVAVNRVWHHLLGQGIVATVDNFGVLGKQPTHPELLDHLATTFREDDWSLKQLIRRIVLSQTYQMSSVVNPDATVIDPDNLLLHRARIKRLQGEAIRDAILQISGRLDRKMFGPAVPIHLTSFMSGRGRPGKSGPLDGEGRRSVYISVRRNFLSPMMLAFDTPIPFNSIGKRNQSNVPAQALILMNDPFVLEQAKQWATRLIGQTQNVEQRIEQIYFQSVGRPPESWEKERAERFLSKQAEELRVSEDELLTDVRIWQDYCHVMFNVKEFIFIK